MADQALLNQIGKSLADVFFPRSCVHCKEMVESSPYDFLCRACSREIILSAPPACSTCGYPFFGMLAGPQACPHCVELDPVFDRGQTLFLTKGPARSMIHDLKYHSGFYILKDVATMIAGAHYYQKYIQGAMLVPVPLHPTRLRERGFNQSEKIAHALAKASNGSSSVANLLIREVYTNTQTRLNREQRQQNVKNAFAMAQDAVVNPTQQYIIVDDVFTTGSTLNACASVLRESGATQVKVVTLGHG
jgi:competence protein ComFC